MHDDTLESGVGGRKQTIVCGWCGRPVSELSLDFYETGLVFCNKNCEQRFRKMRREAYVEYREWFSICWGEGCDEDYSWEGYGV